MIATAVNALDKLETIVPGIECAPLHSGNEIRRVSARFRVCPTSRPLCSAERTPVDSAVLSASGRNRKLELP
jgi:hypothetical protein